MDSPDFQNFEAEISVIGACLLDHEITKPSVMGLNPSDFTVTKHQHIWTAILSLYRKYEPIDLVTLTAELKGDGQLEKAGGSLYLAEMLDYVPTSANVGFYVKLVKEQTRRRELFAASRKIASIAREAESADQAQDTAESLLLRLRKDTHASSTPKAIADLINPAFKQLEELHVKGGGIQGVSSGFVDLDKITCGFQEGDLIIIAGRPSMGKTAIALNIAENASKAGKHTLVFSLEMSKGQLVNRLFSSAAKINANDLRKGDLGDDHWRKLTEVSANLNNLPLTIDDQSAITVFDINRKARDVSKTKPLDLIIIDYLQLIRSQPSKFPNREREVAEISRSLKTLAKELKVPVIVLAQLNRSSETGGTPRRPIPSDLRESGSLEQDADLILFPWRESAYCEDCKKAHVDCGRGHFWQAELIIGKQRNGPTGIVKLAWLGEFTKFEPVYH